MKNKLIHIIGAGGPAGVGFTRCIKDHYEVQGHDESPWSEMMMECSQESVPMLNADMVVPVPDAAMPKYSECDLCFTPPRAVVEVCQDKAKCAKLLGNLAPKLLWVRDTHGAGAKGAQMGSEYLPGRNTSVELVFWEGELKATFMKERLSYRVGSVDTDVRGIGTSAVSRCIWDSSMHDVAIEAVSRVMRTPHGIFGVDLKYNDDGKPKVTEINAGRFLTASYDYFQHGYNLPLLAVELFLGEPLLAVKDKDYPLGKVVIRQIGQQAWYGDEEQISYPTGWWK